MNNMKDKITEYFKGVRAEWGKVVWPEKQQVIVDFVWVLLVCAFFTILIFTFDVIYDKLFGLLPKIH